MPLFQQGQPLSALQVVAHEGRKGGEVGDGAERIVDEVRRIQHKMDLTIPPLSWVIEVIMC